MGYNKVLGLYGHFAMACAKAKAATANPRLRSPKGRAQRPAEAAVLKRPGRTIYTLEV